MCECEYERKNGCAHTRKEKGVFAQFDAPSFFSFTHSHSPTHSPLHTHAYSHSHHTHMTIEVPPVMAQDNVAISPSKQVASSSIVEDAESQEILQVGLPSTCELGLSCSPTCRPHSFLLTSMPGPVSPTPLLISPSSPPPPTPRPVPSPPVDHDRNSNET